jgi:hypothetical protein
VLRLGLALGAIWVQAAEVVTLPKSSADAAPAKRRPSDAADKMPAAIRPLVGHSAGRGIDAIEFEVRRCPHRDRHPGLACGCGLGEVGKVVIMSEVLINACQPVGL